MTQGRGSQEEKVGQPTIKEEGSHMSLRRTAAYLSINSSCFSVQV